MSDCQQILNKIRQLVCEKQPPDNGGGDLPQGKRYAICIGIDQYANPADNLNCCVADADRWSRQLESMGFEVEPLLTNSSATREGINDAVRSLIEVALPGDTVVVTYSGHGTYFRQNGRNIQAFVPHDHRSDGYILDYEIGKWVDEQRDGINLTVMADCCHAGTITRTIGGPNDDLMIRQLAPDDEMVACFTEQWESDATDRSASPYSDKAEILFAGCMSTQTAKESHNTGHFTQAALTVLERRGDNLTNAEFIDEVRTAGARFFQDQRPELWSCNSKWEDKLFAAPKKRTFGCCPHDYVT